MITQHRPDAQRRSLNWYHKENIHAGKENWQPDFGDYIV